MNLYAFIELIHSNPQIVPLYALKAIVCVVWWDFVFDFIVWTEFDFEVFGDANVPSFVQCD